MGFEKYGKCLYTQTLNKLLVNLKQTQEGTMCSFSQWTHLLMYGWVCTVFMIFDGPVQIVFIILHPFTRTTIKVTVCQESCSNKHTQHLLKSPDCWKDKSLIQIIWKSLLTFLQRRCLDLLRLWFWTVNRHKIIWNYKRKNTQIIKSILTFVFSLQKNRQKAAHNDPDAVPAVLNRGHHNTELSWIWWASTEGNITAGG